MLSTLIIGLGRAGLGLHLPVLRRARTQRPGLFTDQPVVAVDPGAVPPPEQPGLRLAESLRSASGLLDPERTVVHLCTPPSVRTEVLAEVAALGFTKVLVEKPLAGDRAALTALLDVVRRHRLQYAVVAPWLHSTLTRRLLRIVEDGGLGAVRSVSVTQHKPRFRRSLAAPGHTSAFDVEVPHAVGVLLRLLGDAQVRGAACGDLRVGPVSVPRMGSARLELAHPGGVRSEVLSDLSAPVRQRRIVLDLAHGRVHGHYAVGEDDDYAQLEIAGTGPDGAGPVHEVLRDDSLSACLTQAYTDFAAGTDLSAELRLHARTVELLDEAKRRAAGSPTGPCVPRAGEAVRRAG